jgi:hypothetical protein
MTDKSNCFFSGNRAPLSIIVLLIATSIYNKAAHLFLVFVYDRT